jgi:tetratricopeptide (TPR) repeat protein
MQAGQFDAAAAAFKEAANLPPRIDTYPSPPDLGATSSYQYGQALEKSGDMEAAIAVYAHALTAWPQHQGLHLALGMALLRQDRVSEALKRLEQARGLMAKFDLGLWVALAKVHLFLGHHADAHALYRETFSQKPDDRDTLTGLIRTSVAMDDVESLLAALEVLMNGLGMDTDRELATPADIARLCAEVGAELYDRQDIPPAAGLAEAALAIDGSCAAAHLLLSDTLFSEGNRFEAIKHLEQATHAGAPLAMIEKRLALLESS